MPCSNTKSHPAWDKLDNTGPQGPQGPQGESGNDGPDGFKSVESDIVQITEVVKLAGNMALGTIQVPEVVTVSYLIDVLKEMGIVSKEPKPWSEVADFKGVAASDYAGWSVSLSADGRTVAVSGGTYVWYDDNTKDNPGQVRVFSYNDTNDEWDTMGEIEGVAAGDNAGYSVSLSADGRTVAVGSPRSSASKGHVRVFSYNDAGSKWVPLGNEGEIGGEAAGDRAGHSVSLSADGRTVAVGAPLHDADTNDTYDNRGHVRVFSYNDAGSKWVPLGNEGEIGGEAAGDRAGHSVSLSADGRTVAIGAVEHDKDGEAGGRGQVRVFSYNDAGSKWVPLGNEGEIGGEAAGDRAGHSVSLSADGRTVAVGAPFHDADNNNTDDDRGHVRVFSYTGIRWTQIGGNIEGVAGDYAGWSVSLSADGRTVAVGANVEYGGERCDYRGQVRVFSYEGTEWTPIGGNIEGEAAGDNTGYSVSLSADGKTVAVGAPFHDLDDTTGCGADNRGHVRVFKL